MVILLLSNCLCRRSDKNLVNTKQDWLYLSGYTQSPSVRQRRMRNFHTINDVHVSTGGILDPRVRISKQRRDKTANKNKPTRTDSLLNTEENETYTKMLSRSGKMSCNFNVSVDISGTESKVELGNKPCSLASYSQLR